MLLEGWQRKLKIKIENRKKREKNEEAENATAAKNIKWVQIIYARRKVWASACVGQGGRAVLGGGQGVMRHVRASNLLVSNFLTFFLARQYLGIFYQKKQQPLRQV